MSRDSGHFICQTAANAIISEIGHYRVSSDALQVINQFLDEFLVLLLSSSLSLDLSRIKTVVFTLLPSTLGKNAIVEAELEVKTFTETEAIDYDTYERMRSLGDSGPFPLDAALPLLRDRCVEFCTLADRNEQNNQNKSAEQRDIFISPIVAIYVTTVLEHIAEYVLTAIAMTAENDDTEYIRINHVFLALIDDVQVGGVFYRMSLREKLEKRALANGYKPRVPRASTLAPQRYSHVSTTSTQGNGFLDIAFDDDDIGYDEDEGDFTSRPNTLTPHDYLSASGYSMKSSGDIQYRPTSMMSSSTSNGTISTSTGSTNSKKAFKVFKKDQFDSPEHDHPSQQRATVSVYDPDTPAMNFEELIRSGNTVKVSLTPSRLRSIEVKDQTVDYPTLPKTSWERRSTTNLRKSFATSSQATAQVPASSSFNSRVKKGSTLDSNHEFDSRQMATVSDWSKEMRPDTAIASGLARQEPSKYENPRQAPKPPSSQKPANMPWPPPVPSLTSSKAVPESVPPTNTQMPVQKPTTSPKYGPVQTPGLTRTQTVPTFTSQSPPSPELPRSTSMLAQTSTSPSETTTAPKKKEVTVLRRSSSSSRKSRENLRRQREKDELAAKANCCQPELPSSPKSLPEALPKNASPEKPSPSLANAVQSSDVSTKSVNESVESITLPSPPASETSTSESKDSKDYESERSSFKEGSKASSVASFDSEERKVHFGSVERLGTHKNEHEAHPERPSSIVAKRVSVIGTSRRHSLHESFAAQGEKVDVIRQNLTITGSVGKSVKAWDEITKNEDGAVATTPSAPRKASIHVQQQSLENASSDIPSEAEKKKNAPISKPSPPLVSTGTVNNSAATQATLVRPIRTVESGSVLDKVLKFERASSLDDFAQQHHRQHRASAYYPRRERFLYLQREPGLIERSTFIKSRPITVDAQVQTDPLPEPVSIQSSNRVEPPALMITTEDDMGVTSRQELDIESISEHSSEHGMVEGDEEWFLQDDEWEDVQDQESAVVEWLLGEA